MMLTGLVFDSHYVSKLNSRTICLVRQLRCHEGGKKKGYVKATELKVLATSLVFDIVAC